MFKLVVNNLFKGGVTIQSYSVSKSYAIAKMAVLLALLIVCSQITLPLGPIPLTLQTFVVLLIGLTASPQEAVIVTSLYLVAGVLGLPVFAGFSGGFHSLLRPSFGFILGFIPAAGLGAYSRIVLQEKKRGSTYPIAALLMTLIIYSAGLLYMEGIFNRVQELDLSLRELLNLALIPFIPGDILKLLLACMTAKRINRIL